MRYHQNMDTVTKVTITVPSRLVRKLRRGVAAGKARSLSAYVTDAIEKEIDRDDDQAVLDEILAEHGEPTPAEEAWVADALQKTYGTTK